MNKKLKIKEWENIKVPREIVNRLRKLKEKTGVTLMAFTKNAILEKLEKEKL